MRRGAGTRGEGARGQGGGRGPRGRAGSAHSGPARVLHHAVRGGEHPLLVDQHTSAVELTALEQGHLPGLGASWTRDSINNLVPTLVALVWTETWRNTRAASLRGRLSQQLRDLETDGDRQTDKETGRKGERCRKSRRWRRRETEAAHSEAQGEHLVWGPPPKLMGETLRARHRVWGARRPREAEGSRNEGGRRQRSLVFRRRSCWSWGGPEQARPGEWSP